MSWVQNQMPNSPLWQSLWSTWLVWFCRIRDLCKLRQACSAIRYHLTATLAVGSAPSRAKQYPPLTGQGVRTAGVPLSLKFYPKFLCVYRTALQEILHLPAAAPGFLTG